MQRNALDILQSTTDVQPFSAADLDPPTVAAPVALPGKPEFAAVDSRAGHMYCIGEDKNSVVAIDTETC